LILIGHSFLRCAVVSDTDLHLGVAITQDHMIDEAERPDVAGAEATGTQGERIRQIRLVSGA